MVDLAAGRMTAKDFREALRALDWTQEQAADLLGIYTSEKPNAGRVNEWYHGRRSIPPYIAKSVRAHLRLYSAA